MKENDSLPAIHLKYDFLYQDLRADCVAASADLVVVDARRGQEQLRPTVPLRRGMGVHIIAEVVAHANPIH